MARESFEDPRIADLLNTNFIPIKIDREERPDIDRVYMDFLQVTTGGGGWPLNVFVTPQLEPIYGGTYWPGPNSERASRGGTFDLVLERMNHAWQEQEGRCRENASQIVAQLKQFAQEGTLSAKSTRTKTFAFNNTKEEDLPELELLEDAYQQYESRFDEKCGGFGPAPKFPTPTHLGYLLRLGQWNATVSDVIGAAEVKNAQDMACLTLQKMALGGINDQLDKGFARYSVTRDWSLPHFEKMLYDNAQLLPLYLDAWLLTKTDLFLDTAISIANYLISPPILNAVGAFNASEDADSAPSMGSIGHKEGAFYTWEANVFRAAIGDERIAGIAAAYWNVQEEGNVSHTHDPQGELRAANTLCVAISTADIAKKFQINEDDARAAIEVARSRLLAHRQKHRPRPHLDDKIVVSWNGLAIGGLARLAGAISDTVHAPQAARYLGAAQGAAAFIRRELYDESSHALRRVYREGPGPVPGFADDYAHLIAGLIDLYEVTFDDSCLSWAVDLQNKQTQDFYDSGATITDGSGASNIGDEVVGGYFNTSSGAADVLIRSKDAMDNAEPSTNGVSASNLFRLGFLLDSSEYISLAHETVKSFDVEMSQHPSLFTGLLGGVVMSRLGVRGLLVSGSGAEIEQLVNDLRRTVRPGTVVLRIGGDSEAGYLKQRNSLLKDLDPDKNMVQLCEGTSCKLLAPAEVINVLRTASS